MHRALALVNGKVKREELLGDIRLIRLNPSEVVSVHFYSGISQSVSPPLSQKVPVPTIGRKFFVVSDQIAMRRKH